MHALSSHVCAVHTIPYQLNSPKRILDALSLLCQSRIASVSDRLVMMIIVIAHGPRRVEERKTNATLLNCQTFSNWNLHQIIFKDPANVLFLAPNEFEETGMVASLGKK